MNRNCHGVEQPVKTKTVFRFVKLQSSSCDNLILATSAFSFQRRVIYTKYLLIEKVFADSFTSSQGSIHITKKLNTNRPYNLSQMSLEEKGFQGQRGQCLANFRYLKESIYSWSYLRPMWITITLQLHSINRINLFGR